MVAGIFFTQITEHMYENALDNETYVHYNKYKHRTHVLNFGKCKLSVCGDTVIFKFGCQRK